MGHKFTKYDENQTEDFFKAVDYQRIDELEAYFAQGMFVNQKEAALLRACQKMLMKSIDFLLLHNAKVDVLDDNGYSPLHFAIYKRSTELAIKLLQHGAGANFSGPKESPLHGAVYQDCEEIVSLLLENNADANAQITGCNPPLFEALRTGNVSVVQLLLNHGADINARRNTSDGVTVLGASLWEVEKFERLAALFVESGADFYNIDLMGNSALHNVESMVTALLLVQRRKANINALNKKRQSPLHTNPSRQILKLLLEAGADMEAIDEDGNTSLHAQANAGNLHAVEAILKSPKGPILLHAVNKNGETPLHVAVGSDSKGKVAILVQALLDHGASLHAVDKDGKTPHDVAKQKGRNTLVAMLAIQTVKENADISFK